MQNGNQFARALANQRLSRAFNMYFNQEVETLAAEVPHVVTLHFDKVVQQYTGTFALDKAKAFRAVFDGPRVNNKATMRPMICTYVITNTVNGRVYVGSSTEFYVRWNKHYGLLRSGKHTNLRLQEEFDEHGEEAFTMTILRCFSTTRTLLEHEVQAGRAYPSNLLLNYRLGNTCVGGWYPDASRGMGRGARPPRKARGPNTVDRWFDGTGVRH